jgi:hypothetical protein
MLATEMAGPHHASLTVAALALLSVSCVFGPKPVLAENVLQGSYCAPPHALTTHAARPEDPTLSTQTAVMLGYSARSLDTARAIGAASALERLAEAQAHHAPNDDVIDLRGQLNDAIFFATIEIQALVARMRCEEGRADQIAGDLRDAEEKQTRRLTAYSLGASALSAIGVGTLAIVLDSQTPANIVGITGGIVGGALGAGTLAVHRETTFVHKPNLLGELWRGQDHGGFPPIVWAYLTREQFTDPGAPSLREQLMQTWSQSGRFGSDPEHRDPSRVSLYFGDGGVYDAKALDDRSNMLSELREALGLMHYDLQLLSREASHR